MSAQALVVCRCPQCERRFRAIPGIRCPDCIISRLVTEESWLVSGYTYDSSDMTAEREETRRRVEVLGPVLGRKTISRSRRGIPNPESSTTSRMIPDETIEKIRELYASGMTMREVARELHISESTVSAKLRECGDVTGNMRGKRRKVTGGVI